MPSLNINQAKVSGGLKFSPQQITAIKNSPKGKLPAFISGGAYNKDGVTSIGGRVGGVGGTIGIENKSRKPFGSVNVKGKVVGKFGPQGY